MRDLDDALSGPEYAADFDDALGSALARSILDSSPDCIKLIALDGTLVYMNDNGICAMEIENFCSIQGKLWPSLWPEEAQEMLESAVEDAVLGKSTDFEAYCPTATGTPRWWEVNVSPVRDGDGVITHVLATSRDITTRIRSESTLRERDLQLQSYAEKLAIELEEKKALLDRQHILTAEIDHRVKNSYALIGSLLRIKIRSIENLEARDALTDAANRIATLSRIHEQLHNDVEAQRIALAPYLENLTADLGKTLTDASTVRLTDRIELSVASDVAIALGLITTELVSNALKHRRLGGPTHVTVSLAENVEDGSLTLRIADSGEGLPEGFDIAASRGLGMQICQRYASSLDGTLTAENAEGGGAVFRLDFPKVTATARR